MMFRKTLFAAAVFVAVVALSPAARADTVTLVSVFNDTGLTASVSSYSLVGNTFTFTVTNTPARPARPA